MPHVAPGVGNASSKMLLAFAPPQLIFRTSTRKGAKQTVRPRLPQRLLINVVGVVDRWKQCPFCL